MKNKLCLLLLACVTFSTIQAQQILKPTNPSETCAQAWQDYRKADILWKTGWGLFGAGLVVGTIGGCCIYFGSWGNYDGQHGGISPLSASGCALLSVGGGMLIASIPCLAVGQRRKASQSMYQERCGDQLSLTFSLQTSANGLGLAMQF